ncbi:hypothetical protein SBF1_3390009 [Candidatus Desulfosporosinus infrequens]|uniref:Uncharacterized protein n=1 Tax=Candidatus Desulfosporosinus infrequens TaxID=2043169 RepID=A0A2U3L1F7_9FIRM|nr:hypothetical protein SBF1_3390009 [Candidatus Desulfosporosinus infrequens]
MIRSPWFEVSRFKIYSSLFGSSGFGLNIRTTNIEPRTSKKEELDD